MTYKMRRGSLWAGNSEQEETMLAIILPPILFLGAAFMFSLPSFGKIKKGDKAAGYLGLLPGILFVIVAIVWLWKGIPTLTESPESVSYSSPFGAAFV